MAFPICIPNNSFMVGRMVVHGPEQEEHLGDSQRDQAVGHGEATNAVVQKTTQQESIILEKA